MATKKTNTKQASSAKKSRSTFGAIVQRDHKSKKTGTKKRVRTDRPALTRLFAFTGSVFRTLVDFRAHYGIFLVVYVIVALLLFGLSQQDQYRMIVDSVNEFGSALLGSEMDVVSKTFGIFGVALTGGLNSSFDPVQQLYMGLMMIIMGLAVIWLLRQLLAGNEVKVRDGLYNGSAPLVSTLLIFALMIAQALPGALGVFAFTLATQNSGIGGGTAVILGLIAIAFSLLSLYWLASSVFALFVVTLPGTYPMEAIHAAGDLVAGRRFVLMLRLVWLAIIVVAVWAVVLTPILFLDAWINIQWFPLIPLFVQLLSGFSLLLVVTYLYLLYRELINEPAR